MGDVSMDRGADPIDWCKCDLECEGLDDGDRMNCALLAGENC